LERKDVVTNFIFCRIPTISGGGGTDSQHRKRRRKGPSDNWKKTSGPTQSLLIVLPLTNQRGEKKKTREDVVEEWRWGKKGQVWCTHHWKTHKGEERQEPGIEK